MSCVCFGAQRDTKVLKSFIGFHFQRESFPYLKMYAYVSIVHCHFLSLSLSICSNSALMHVHFPSKLKTKWCKVIFHDSIETHTQSLSVRRSSFECDFIYLALWNFSNFMTNINIFGMYLLLLIYKIEFVCSLTRMCMHNVRVTWDQTKCWNEPSKSLNSYYVCTFRSFSGIRYLHMKKIHAHTRQVIEREREKKTRYKATTYIRCCCCCYLYV